MGSATGQAGVPDATSESVPFGAHPRDFQHVSRDSPVIPTCILPWQPPNNLTLALAVSHVEVMESSCIISNSERVLHLSHIFYITYTYHFVSISKKQI